MASSLPFEGASFGEFVVDPFRRASLDQLDRVGDVEGFGEREQKVNVVRDTADREEFHFVRAGDAADISVKTSLQVCVDHRAAVFGGEDAVV